MITKEESLDMVKEVSKMYGQACFGKDKYGELALKELTHVKWKYDHNLKLEENRNNLFELVKATDFNYFDMQFVFNLKEAPLP